MTAREHETRELLREAARRMPHGWAEDRGCPAATCFRCQVLRFLHSPEESRGERMPPPKETP